MVSRVTYNVGEFLHETKAEAHPQWDPKSCTVKLQSPVPPAVALSHQVCELQ